MSTLYKISQKYSETFDNLIDYETGEIKDCEILEQIADEYNEKVENLVYYIKNKIALIKAIKAEEENLKIRRTALENNVKSYEQYLVSCMDKANKDRYESANNKITFRKSIITQINDETLIPLDYITIKEEKKINKEAIKKAIQAGETIAGAVLIENKNIQIK